MTVRSALLLLVLCAAPAAAQQEQAPPTAARDLARGEVLAAEDIAFAAGAPAAGSPVGWVTRRVVAEGEVLRAPAIAPADLIASGDVVEVLWRQGPLELRLRGRAMGSAAQGERVLVRVDSQRRLEGVAVGPRLIRIETKDLRK